MAAITTGLIDTGIIIEENGKLKRDYDNIVRKMNQMTVEIRSLRLVTEKQIDEMAKLSHLLALAEIYIKKIDPDFNMESLLKF